MHPYLLKIIDETHNGIEKYIEKLTIIVAQIVAIEFVVCAWSDIATSDIKHSCSCTVIYSGKRVPIIGKRQKKIDAMLLCKFDDLIQTWQTICPIVNSCRPVGNELKPCPVCRYHVYICTQHISQLLNNKHREWYH
jgi:hypothetical protein